MRPGLKAALVVTWNAILVCAALALAEFTARKIESARYPGRRESLDRQLDRWTAFRNTPGFARPGVHHAAEGFRRDHEVSVEKPPGDVRVFLLGGSVAYGAETVYPEIDNRWNIGDHETIDYYLERELNAAFPSKHWEVINAATKSYRLHQDLARILATVLRYKPDFVILLDGENDLGQLLSVSANDDPYQRTAMREEFNDLTNPQSPRSLSVMLSTWLGNNSALYRAIREAMLERFRRRAVVDRARAPAVAKELHLEDLSLNQEAQYRNTVNGLRSYRHVVRQIHSLLSLDGVRDLFALQPELRLTRKPLVDREPQLAAYDRAVVGRLQVFGFETLYPLLAKQLAADAESEGYGFLDMTSVFDQVPVQTFTDYCHLTPAGNRVIAHALLEFMRKGKLVE
jgi:lysophospholipase L1-like esterase